MRSSYLDGDVEVLLEEINPVFLTVEEKEQAIQKGTHYSEILSVEKSPSESYQDLFRAQVEVCGPELANRFHDLAAMIAATRKKPVIVSLVRGGTPIGVILKRILQNYGIQTYHYTVSIIRDKGLDLVAIAHILKQGHKPEDLAFVDGWTGKGVIRTALSYDIKKLQQTWPSLKDELYVLADIAGMADYAGTRTDMLIPTCLLNATVSGLLSRSVFRQNNSVPQMHGAAYLDELSSADLSQWFVERMMSFVKGEMAGGLVGLIAKGRLAQESIRNRAVVAEEMRQLIRSVMHAEGVTDRNMIKPGIGEASRVLLRRIPDLLLLKDPSDSAVEHLVHLANARNVPIKVNPEMKIQAVAIIKRVGND